MGGSKRGLKTGFVELDKFLELETGLVPFQCGNSQWLNCLTNQILARNYVEGKKTLLLQFLDYHERYWSLNFDEIVKNAKSQGVNLDSFLDNTFVLRAFSRDTVESPAFWARAIAFAENTGLAVLDSVNELYDSTKKRELNSKPLAYSIARFREILQRNQCIGLALDYSLQQIPPFLGEASSAIIYFRVQNGVYAKVMKHSSMKEGSFEIPIVPQRNLRKWLW